MLYLCIISHQKHMTSHSNGYLMSLMRLIFKHAMYCQESWYNGNRCPGCPGSAISWDRCPGQWPTIIAEGLRFPPFWVTSRFSLPCCKCGESPVMKPAAVVGVRSVFRMLGAWVRRGQTEIIQVDHQESPGDRFNYSALRVQLSINKTQ